MKLTVDIRKRFGNFTLCSSFETQDMITGLLGASGCGKSMTLKCIAGIETPDEGIIRLDDTILYSSKDRINLRPQERKVGYLFQNYALFPTMTVRKNILTGVHNIKDKKERERRYEEALALLHLEGLEGHRPYQLSGGQAQRVALARMIVGQPQLLLLDEPFSALDTHLKDKLQADMKTLIETLGKQAVMVTHSLSEAYRLCSWTCVMEGGSIIRAGKTDEVFKDPQKAGCARIFGHRNILSLEKTKDGKAYLPELGIEMAFNGKVPDTCSMVAIPDQAIGYGSDYRVTVMEVLQEPDGVNLLLSTGGKTPIWWKSSQGNDLSDFGISIDSSKCIFLS